MRFLSKGKAFLIALVLTMLVLPMGAIAQDEETTLQRIVRTGQVTIGFFNEIPFAYASAPGELDGEAVRIGRAVLEKVISVDAELQIDGVLVSTFGSLIPGLQAGRFDIIMAGMFVNPSRCEQVLFADPEYKTGEALAVAAGNPFGVNSYEDIAATPEFRVGTGVGFAEEEKMLAVGVSPDQITLFDTADDGLAAIQAGRVDGFTGTSQNTQIKVAELGEGSGVELASPFTQPDVDGDGEPDVSFGASAFRVEDRDLRNAFNDALDTLKDSGELGEILDSVQGFSAAQNDPGDVTTAELCPGTPNDPS